MSKCIDLTGQRFGKLIVLKRVKSNKRGLACFLCQCDCGSDPIVVVGTHLRNGNTKSCGCLQKERAAATWKGKKIPKEFVKK